MTALRRIAPLLLAAALLTGCTAASKAFKQAEKDARMHRWDEAVLSYSKAASLQPDNTRYSIALTKARFRASQEHFELGKKYLAAEQLDLAIAELQATILLDPSNQYAADELREAIRLYEESRLSEKERTELEELKEKMSVIGTAPPKLDPASNVPIGLKFKDEEIGKIYDVLSRVTGINFFYDDKLDLKKRVSIDVANVSFEKAMDILMLQNKHFYKVLDDNSIVIADDNRQKRQEYEDEVIQTFYLSNADVKDVQTILRTLLDARKVAQSNQLNSITIRDSPEKVAIARRIIESNDKSKAELVIDVELLQINRTTLRNLGIDLTQKSISIGFNEPTGGVPLNNLGIIKQQGAWSLTPVPGFIINFLKSDSDAKVIAKPQMRVTEGEKANLHIGDRIPIPTTSFNTAGTIGANVVPITSFTYQEVGIIIELEPRVHHNREVTLNLSVEISNVTGSVSAGGGVSQPIIGSREINTVIRLKDGETNLLAGLLQETTQTSLSGVAGLSEIPYLKRLFGSTEKQMQQIDIVLTLTPHIIRIPDIRERDMEALWIGREGNLKLKGAEGSAFGSPFVSAEEAQKDAIGPDKSAMVDTVDPTDMVPSILTEARRRSALPPDVEDESGAGAAPAGLDQGPAAAPQAGPPAAKETPPAGAKPSAGEPKPSAGAAQPPAAAAGPPAPQETAEEPERDMTPVPPVLPPVRGEGAQGTTPAGAAGPPAVEEPTPPPAGPLRLGFSPPTMVARAGSEFNLSLNVDGARDLRRLVFVIQWEGETLEFRTIHSGNFLAQGGPYPNFQFRKEAPTRVRVETTLPEGQGATGKGSVAMARFRALGPGSTNLVLLEVEATDAQGAAVEILPGAGRVTVP